MSRRVLIVEDDAAFAAMLAPLVESNPDFEVAAVESSVLGVAAQRTFDPDDLSVVFCDYHLAGGDTGDEAIGLLRSLETGPRLLIIGLTGESDPAVHDRMRAAGADMVYEKREILAVLMDGALHHEGSTR